MDSLAIIFKELFSCVSPHITLLMKLKSNVESLESESKRLEDVYRDVTDRVEREELHPLNRRLEEVKGWLEKTPALIHQATEMLELGKQELQDRWLCGQCPKSCLSSYRIARNVEKQLAEVKKLLAAGRLEVVTYRLPYHLGEVRPLENVVGYDLIFQDVWSWINDDNVGIVGLYGIGGIGKTTLLTKINNRFTNNDSSSSRLVIWLTVCKSGTVENVQQLIRNRLNLEDENWDQKASDEKCSVIYQFLRGKEFVLLLDDLWERLDLSKVGIPLVGLGSSKGKKAKLVFTTRSKQVCSEMGAEKTIELKGLPQHDAHLLFNSKVGEETLNSHPEIRHLAEAMTIYCWGLPMALVTIGRAMSGKTDSEAWRRTLRFAQQSRSKIASMESQVYPLLKLSYDNLGNDMVKQCFLYCALFPQGAEVPTDILIKCWIKEGILHVDDAHSHGETLSSQSQSQSASTMALTSNDYAILRNELEGLIWSSEQGSLDQGLEIVESLTSTRRLEMHTAYTRSSSTSDDNVNLLTGQELEIEESRKSACQLEIQTGNIRSSSTSDDNVNPLSGPMVRSLKQWSLEQRSLDQGLEIVESLKSACLLDNRTCHTRSFGLWESNDMVKMHDVIRDMALWIAKQEGRPWIRSKAWIERLGLEIMSIDYILALEMQVTAMRQLLTFFDHAQM